MLAFGRFTYSLHSFERTLGAGEGRGSTYIGSVLDVAIQAITISIVSPAQACVISVDGLDHPTALHGRDIDLDSPRGRADYLIG